LTTGKAYPRATILLIVGTFVVTYLCFLLLPELFESWNAKAIDRLFLFRSASSHFNPAYDDTVVHVDLTDSSIERLDNFYLTRVHHALAIRNLASMDISAQLYDFIFAAKTNERDDRALIEATRKAESVYFGLAFKLSHDQGKTEKTHRNKITKDYLDRTKWSVGLEGSAEDFYLGTDPLITFPNLALASRGLGYLSLRMDRDGVFRRLPLLIRYGGAFYPSFAFRAVCGYLDVPPERILVKPGHSITLREAKRPGENRKHDIVIPIDRQGNMVINFIGPWERMKHYNFADVLSASEDRDEMEMWRDELSGKIVIISEVATGSSDMGPVPTDPNYPLSGLHANVIHTILTESFLRELSAVHMFIVEILLLGCILLISLRLTAFYFSLGSFALLVSYVLIAALCFLYGQIILHILRPVLVAILASIAIVIFRYIKQEKERDFIRATFGRYLSKEVVEELLDSPEGLKMSGETRDVTFLVSDLRGFTALSMRLSPKEVIAILNRYLEYMMDIIVGFRGTVNEIEGDGILTFFGAPLVSHDDDERAIACAIAMQRAMEDVNAEQRRRNLPELRMGIGINRGEVVVGNIGSEKRAKYSAIGSAINTAYRIESYTVGGQILVSPSIYEKAESILKTRGTVEARFKGIDQPVILHDVVAIEGDYQVFLPEKKPENLISLEPPMEVRCFPLEGKSVSDESIPGLMTRLGESAAELALPELVEVRSNLKILVDTKEASPLPEIYAKIISVDQSTTSLDGVKVGIEFTWLPEEAKALFDEKRSAGQPSDG